MNHSQNNSYKQQFMAVRQLVLIDLQEEDEPAVCAMQSGNFCRFLQGLHQAAPAKIAKTVGNNRPNDRRQDQSKPPQKSLLFYTTILRSEYNYMITIYLFIYFPMSRVHFSSSWYFVTSAVHFQEFSEPALPCLACVDSFQDCGS